MKKSNKNILIYSSAVKALSHLDKVDIHPGSDQRNLDAAYQRLDDIKTISQMLVDQSIDEQIANQKKQKFVKTGEKARLTNQGKRKDQIEATETVAIISVLSCILIIVVLALLK